MGPGARVRVMRRLCVRATHGCHARGGRGSGAELGGSRAVLGDRPADRAGRDPAEHAGDPVVGDRQHRQPQRLTGPLRHQSDRRGDQHPVRRSGDQRELGLVDEVRHGVAGVVDRRAAPAGTARRRRAARPRSSAGRAAPSLRATNAACATYSSYPAWSSGCGPEPPVGEQEALDLGDVHPLEQVRVVRVVRRAVRHRAVHPVVDRAHDVDRLLRVVGGAERRDREVAAGARQPAPHVAAVAGVLGDRGHRLRLQGLQQHGPDPADEHRRVAVHDRDRAALGEPARPRRAVDPLPVLGAVRSRPRAGTALARAAHASPPGRAYGRRRRSRTPERTAATRRSTSASRNGSPRNSSTPASEPGPCLGVAGGEPHRQVAVADVVELGDGQREVLARGDPAGPPAAR